MAKGIRIQVTLKSGEIKYHTLPFGLRDREIHGWVWDEYGIVQEWKEIES